MEDADEVAEGVGLRVLVAVAVGVAVSVVLLVGVADGVELELCVAVGLDDGVKVNELVPVGVEGQGRGSTRAVKAATNVLTAFSDSANETQ